MYLNRAINRVFFFLKACRARINMTENNIYGKLILLFFVLEFFTQCWSK